MDNLRIVLIVVASLVIIALLIHGFWINKKERSSLFTTNKNGDKKKKTPPSIDIYDNDNSDSGIIGDVRIISPKQQTAQLDKEEQPPISFVHTQAEEDEPVQRDLFNHAKIKDDVSDTKRDQYDDLFAMDEPANQDTILATTSRNSATRHNSTRHNDTRQSSSRNSETNNSHTNTPVNATEKSNNANRTSQEVHSQRTTTAKQDSNKEWVSEPQADLNVAESKPKIADTVPSEPKPATTEQTTEMDNVDAKIPQDETDILILYVTGINGKQIQGDLLLNSIVQCGFQFGEMKIFHRHVDPAGNGPILFSLANMLNPGYLDPETMHEFTTQGVSLFMVVPSKGNNQQNFKLMLQTAQRIADDVDGVVLDDSQHMLTPQKIDNYKNRIKKVCHEI
ncbi:cell division protein ZipA [Orbaceae bacterium ESL0727]|nr:cell division protein ZipA [Orbaceae bacterium ESL0727]